jgi:hypothetical protein
MVRTPGFGSVFTLARIDKTCGCLVGQSSLIRALPLKSYTHQPPQRPTRVCLSSSGGKIFLTWFNGG